MGILLLLGFLYFAALLSCWEILWLWDCCGSGLKIGARQVLVIITKRKWSYYCYSNVIALLCMLHLVAKSLLRFSSVTLARLMWSFTRNPIGLRLVCNISARINGLLLL